ncbi:hypothetical protein HCN44_001974 [Aphidius gifuensis]|uniref:Spaetzle domain-containing protein n=1 Tax=Aphidius gifuensis TaxID=684658 RepID=A0A834Y2C7_APHGI|nr:uncharacterized protein LOC122861226 [Aphidius gifuensis]KAF7996342.1 hypothetical protein HCN44_001974 [Aphidius gifuensis]
MRIEALRALIAVVWLTALLWPKFTVADNFTQPISSRITREDPSSEYNWILPQTDKPKLELTYREMQNILRIEEAEKGKPVGCCRTVEYHISPAGGSNRSNMYVELYRDSTTNQSFYEVSCHPDYVDKPCRFIDRKLAPQSKCVQQYSFSYALIKDPDEHKHRHKAHHSEDTGPRTPWILDHIRIRSGCACQLTSKPKKKRVTNGTKVKKDKSKTRRPHDQEFDDNSKDNYSIKNRHP